MQTVTDTTVLGFKRIVRVSIRKKTDETTCSGYSCGDPTMSKTAPKIAWTRPRHLPAPGVRHFVAADTHRESGRRIENVGRSFAWQCPRTTRHA